MKKVLALREIRREAACLEPPNLTPLTSVSRMLLGVIRSLGRGGVQVHIAWHDPSCVSLRSRYLHKAHSLPVYDEKDSAWKEALCKLMQREQFDLVLPCTDVDTLVCWRHKSELEKWGRVYTPNDVACRVLFDKHKTNELARSAGVRTPRELLVKEAQDAREALVEFGSPVVLKPRRTFDARNLDSGPQVRKAYTRGELDRFLPLMLESGPVAIQENFVGLGTGVELLLNEGEPLMAFQHLRVHEPLQGGQSSYRKSVPLSPELLDAALQILRPLQYTGVAMVEFKVNPKTGNWVFIEVNPRFWGSLPLSIAAGADFPLSLYQLLVERRLSFPQGYRTGIYCRNLTLDLSWQVANLFADRTDPTLATQPLHTMIGETCANLLAFRERSDTLTFDDPGPGFAELLELARWAFSRQAWRKVLNQKKASPSHSLPLKDDPVYCRAGKEDEAHGLEAFRVEPAASRDKIHLLESQGETMRASFDAVSSALEVSAALGLAASTHSPEAVGKWQTSVVVLKDVSELGKYVPAWEDLAKATLEPNVFFESWMLMPALRHYGSGKEVEVLLIFGANRTLPEDEPLLLGLFPLESRRLLPGLPFRSVRIWKYIHSFLCTPLVRAGYDRECLEALFGWVASNRAGMVLFEFPTIAGDGAFCRHLGEYLAKSQRHSSTWNCFLRPLFLQRGGGDAYIEEALSSRRRKRLRRQEKLLEKSGPVDYVSLQPEDDIEAWLEEFLHLESRGWKGREGTAMACSDSDREFFRTFGREAFKRSRMMMLSLRSSGRSVAQLCNLLCGEGSFAFKAAFDEKYAKYSPGVLLEVENIQELHRRPEIRWMDSCAESSNSPLNYMWLDQRPIQTVLVSNRKFMGGAYLSALPLLKCFRQLINGFRNRFHAAQKDVEVEIQNS